MDSEIINVVVAVAVIYFVVKYITRGRQHTYLDSGLCLFAFLVAAE